MAVTKFPFDWKKHFVSEENSEDCIPSCLAMAGLYWRSIDKSLRIPSKREEWASILEKMHVHSHRGTNLMMLRNILKTKAKGLSLKLIQPKKLADLTKLFEFTPPIPVILCYDRAMVINNIEGPNHASLVFSIDLTREQIKVVDPSQIYRETPMTYNQDDFIRGWNQVQNQAILVHPTKIRLPINTRDRDSSHTLNNWSKE
ncbi:MAG: hypothetical protein WEB28_02925 [Nitrosopumilaceae archaeon]